MNWICKEDEATGSAKIEAWLIVQNVPGSPWAFPIDTQPQTIGRSSRCAIRLEDQAVSREHAVVWQEAGRAYMRDLKSTNGSLVNHKRVVQSLLVPGDLIQFGQVVFRVCGSHDPDAALKPAESQDSTGTVVLNLDMYRQPGTSASPVISEPEDLLVGGPALDPVRDLVHRAARVDATVLVCGETGTGKELVARMIHQHGPRASGPFVARNCAAVPESLIENELFGHDPGAFTGAPKRYEGVFEQANGGTLLLDEISEIPLSQQAKLLRVIEEQSFQRIGGRELVRVNVRFVGATNTNLSQAVADGDFRRDLFYRLQVLEIRMPPLRARPGDIKLLAPHFIRIDCARWDLPVVELAAEALQKLEAHDWPGNVRELRHTIDRALILSEEASQIGPEHIVFTESPVPSDDQTRLDEREREHIMRVIAGAGGNKSKAAAALGIDRSTLRRKLERLRVH